MLPRQELFLGSCICLFVTILVTVLGKQLQLLSE